MRTRSSFLVLALASLVASNATGQTAAPSASGSAAASAGASSSGNPPPPIPIDAATQDLPPGHPPVEGAAPGSVAGMSGMGLGGTDDASLAEGTVLVEAEGLAPDVLRTLEATLVELRRAKDDTAVRIIATQHLDASSSTRFVQVSQPRGVLYRVVIEHEGVPYASPTFKLNRGAGKRVPVRVYEITTDIDRARIGVQAFAYVEPQDHSLHVEQMFRFANLSESTWRSDAIPLRLPARAEGLETGEGSGPLKVHAVAGQGAMLQGVVPPGVTEVSFQYTLPYPQDELMQLDLGMPPRVGAVRVVAAVGPELDFRVDGLKPSPARNEKGQRLLVAGGAVAPGGDQIENLRMTLTGLPAGGRARWIALMITVLAMAGGLAGAIHLSKSPSKPDRSKPDSARRRQAILDSIAELEVRKTRGEVEQDRYEVERGVLLDRLARLLASSKA